MRIPRTVSNALALGLFALASPVNAGSPLAELPLVFAPNEGQWGEPVRFVARSAGYTALLGDRGLTLLLAGESGLAGTVRLRFEDARPDVRLVPEDLRPGHHNYYVGSDPVRWRERVPLFGRVVYRGLGEGVDLVVQEGHEGLRYDLLLAPGADPSGPTFAVEGACGLFLGESGELLVETEAGTLAQAPPVSWQVTPDGRRVPVTSRFRLLGNDRFGFEVPAWDERFATVVDPSVEWSSFLGGSSSETVSDVVRSPGSGDLTVCGNTLSTDFPIVPGPSGSSAQSMNAGMTDAFVARLNATGTAIVYSTYLGGTGTDRATSLDLDPQDGVVFVGNTDSANFPMAPGASPAQPMLAGSVDGFIGRLDSAGIYFASSFLGGTGFDESTDVVAFDDGTNDVAAVGRTTSSNFPIPPAANTFQSVAGGTTGDTFLSRLDPNLTSFLFSSYLGGVPNDFATGIDETPNGDVVIVGATGSGGFGTAGVVQPTLLGNDAYAARFDTTVTGPAAQIWFTYLGAPGTIHGANDVVVDAQSRPTIIGFTQGGGFPANLAGIPTFNSTFVGNTDVFVLRLDATASTVEHRSFLGGDNADSARGLSLDRSGFAYLSGNTLDSTMGGPTFPTTAGAADTVLDGFSDGFLARVDPTGTLLTYSSLLGGSASDSCQGIVATELTSAAVVVGQTSSSDFPVTLGAADPTYLSGEGYLTQDDFLPAGVGRYGASTPSCTGNVVLSVSEQPASPGPNFLILAAGAPPSTLGYHLLSAAPAVPGIPFLGITFLVPLSNPPTFFAQAVLSDVNGYAIAPTAVPAGIPSGIVTLYTQIFFFNTATCGGGGYSASDALAFTIQ